MTVARDSDVGLLVDPVDGLPERMNVGKADGSIVGLLLNSAVGTRDGVPVVNVGSVVGKEEGD